MSVRDVALSIGLMVAIIVTGSAAVAQGVLEELEHLQDRMTSAPPIANLDLERECDKRAGDWRLPKCRAYYRQAGYAVRWSGRYPCDDCGGNAEVLVRDGEAVLCDGNDLTPCIALKKTD